jgi:hypothetical protein
MFKNGYQNKLLHFISKDYLCFDLLTVEEAKTSFVIYLSVKIKKQTLVVDNYTNLHVQ